MHFRNLISLFWFLLGSNLMAMDEEVFDVLETYCLDCHDAASAKGDFNLEKLLLQNSFDGSLIFENLLTGKMPPSNKKQPDSAEKQRVLEWLAGQQSIKDHRSFRRVSRHEFVNSLNDLFGINLDLSGSLPEDRGTNDFDSSRKIQLSREMLGSYFKVADEMLEHAFPLDGFPVERQWVTNKVRDSHEIYRSFHRPYLDGTLFSWTRSNNGISYSFFYDGISPPVAGWYDLTFETAKVADFEDEMSLQVHAGRYYYADDRPQPQRLLGVISVGNKELESKTIRAFLKPGDCVSVHCFSPHNFRQKNPRQGLYIKELNVKGPVQDSWPPKSYRQFFEGLAVKAGMRATMDCRGFRSNLRRIGGSVKVSSFQNGMEKEKMQDWSNLTFWHTRFSPTVAKPPHYVILENPNEVAIKGLSFATWAGGNGNGLVKSYEIYFSDDGKSWGEKVMSGHLDVRFANEQPIVFPEETKSRYLKLLVTDAVSLDGKSIASIGRLDVVTDFKEPEELVKVTVSSKSPDDLKLVLREFAQRAFSSQPGDEELAPYLETALASLRREGDFVEATKLGLKAIVCSPRFLMAPGEHANSSYARAAFLSRVLWLSVPDEELLGLASRDQLHGGNLRVQIRRMLEDGRSQRMIRSFSDQWLNLRGLSKVTPSLKLYPLYDDLLDYYLPMETRTYLNHLIQEDLPAGILIDSDFSFLNQRLARHYGVKGVVGQDLRKVRFPKGSPRGGLMTMGSVLKVTTDGYDTSPILRGAWISKNLIGTPLSPPPESVPALEPEHGHARTLREQIEVHKNNKACHACHKSIDPYGFALENFDATGEWRASYKIKQPHRSTFVYRPQGYFRMGEAVDAAGEIDGKTFTDIFGLKKILLTEERKIAYNFAKKFFEYANGYQADLSQRLHFWNHLGEKSDHGRLKNVVTEVLIYSLQPSQK
jgi:hypothetical protein